MKRLSYREVLGIVSGKPVDELILVGGQALNAWAEALGIADENSDSVYGAALSDDIDFLGLAPAAIALAEALGGRVELARMDDHTPNAAVVTFDFEGERNVIDVLHSLHGFSRGDLNRVRDWAAVPEAPDTLSNKLRVMHPAHCLQSQLANVYGTLNRRNAEDGARNANRVRLLCEVIRRTVARYMEMELPDSARALIEKVHELARTGPGLRANAEDAIDLVAGIATQSRLGDAFLEKRLPQLNRALARSRARYARRRGS